MIIQGRGGQSELIIKAPAKINVGLRILGQRADGYHEIWSILQEIELWDEVRLREAPDLCFSLEFQIADLPADDTNLCLRAARLLQHEAPTTQGAQIRLTKRIPIGAGLGGGSSDAAAVLMGLNKLWKLRLPQARILELAGQLGSDVPFFILGGCCLARGRGEILEKIKPVLCDWLLVVAPLLHISTAWAYKNIEKNSLTKALEIINLNDLKKEDLQRVLMNDFEPLVFAHFPALGEFKQQLLQSGAYFASLSGSGSSIYGAFHSEESVRRAADLIRVDGQKYLLNRRAIC